MSPPEPASKDKRAPHPGPRAAAESGRRKAEPEPTTEELLGGLQDRVGELLESALAERVVSESPHQLTGSSYQTIRMGDRVRGGVRMSRPNLLPGFELEGRSICDLGANLGEISRDLRRAGASRVDAYEYDPFFNQLARYITACNGISDLNHFQANVAEEGFLRRRYDICVGLSAFSFMKENIDYICSRIRHEMIIETHAVRHQNWPKVYVEPITRHFPQWCCFGRVKHGGAKSTQRRLWLAFSKQSLMGFIARRVAVIHPDAEGVIEVDLQRSPLSFLDRTETILEHRDDPFSKAALRLYTEKLDEYERQFEADETVNLAMSGEAYWLSLMRGIAQVEADGGLAADNAYLRWMTRGVAAGQVDPGLKPLLEDRERLHAHVSLRIALLGKALRERDIRHFRGIPIGYNMTPSHPAMEALNVKTFAVSGSDERLCAPGIDGHHRLFVMKVLGIDRCPMMTIWGPEWLQRHKALRRVENYEQRIYQYLGGAPVDAPVITPRAGRRRPGREDPARETALR